MAKKSRAKLFNQAFENLGIKAPGYAAGMLASGNNFLGAPYAEATGLVMGFEEAKNSPTMQAIAKSLGITNFNSINDYIQLRDYMSKPKAPAAPAPAPATSQASSSATPSLTPEAQSYMNQAAEQMKIADARIKELEDQQLQAQRAQELQQRLAITASANQARSGMTPNLQIAPATQSPQTAGTQTFKRRQQQFMPFIRTMSGINVPTSNVLNV